MKKNKRDGVYYCHKRDTLCIGLIFLSIIALSSCRPDTVELVETTIPIEANETKKSIVTKEKVEKPTIDLDKLEIESVEESIEEKKEKLESKNNEVLEKNKEASIAAAELAAITESIKLESSIKESSIKEKEIQESIAAEPTTENPLDKMYDEDDRVYHGTEKVDTENWRYGMTPCEWVYIEPGIQLISNYKPNTSKTYPANGENKVSSGLKGCYIPVFTKCDMMSNDFEGRFYVFSDYTKATPEEMLFSNSLKTVKYKGIPIEEILGMGFDVSRTNNGLLILNGEYVNIIYATDLDKILNGN